MSAECEYNNLQIQTDVSDLIFQQCVQWCLHSGFISSARSLSHVSLSGSPLWSPGAAISVPPLPPPPALNISLILFPSLTPPLCLKTLFLDANWQRRARTSFSYVILRKKKKGTIMLIHNDTDLAAPQMLDMLWNGPRCARLCGYAEEGADTPKGNLTLDYISAKSAAMSYLGRICHRQKQHSMQLHMRIPPALKSVLEDGEALNLSLPSPCSPSLSAKAASQLQTHFFPPAFKTEKNNPMIYPCLLPIGASVTKNVHARCFGKLASDSGISDERWRLFIFFFLTALVWVCLCSSETFTRPSF